MKPTLLRAAAPFALILAASLAACSPDADAPPQASGTAQSSEAADASVRAAAAPDPAASAEAIAPDDAKVLRLDGLGDLVIGQPVPANSSFKPRGAQISDGCTTLSSPDYPGVYAIMEQGQVRRVTVSAASTVTLEEGIGPGASEAAVREAFPGFVSEPHKYVDAPAKYLTQPGKAPRLRFEIDAKKKVSDLHVGLVPQLLYVEGCA